jgi:hypothetical protein
MPYEARPGPLAVTLNDLFLDPPGPNWRLVVALATAGRFRNPVRRRGYGGA